MSDFSRSATRNTGFPLPASTGCITNPSLLLLPPEVESEDKTIVVTHHVPTFSHYPREYSESILIQAFVVEFCDLVERRGQDYWAYDRHHRNTADFFIGANACRPVSQAVAYGEQETFDATKTIEIPWRPSLSWNI